MASSKEDDVMIVVHLVVLGLRGRTDWSGKLYALELISAGAFKRALLRITVVTTKYRAPIFKRSRSQSYLRVQPLRYRCAKIMSAKRVLFAGRVEWGQQAEAPEETAQSRRITAVTGKANY